MDTIKQKIDVKDARTGGPIVDKIMESKSISIA